ncbi:hypothetical protein [Levilactobacillus namurensis]|uniref:Lower baseplate protein N-terminal domain-containing protein n=1 Tax=Levilactobacillus namurensis TaxID=380393 RepID=A0AAW8W807_9LACO|nr:hypothetical protein [Levilactobacillus namurensis]MDT7014630.1 hypothetical protein [Levilactobacillus namurensis]
MASNDEQRSATTILTTAAQSIAARLIANETTAKFTKAEISTTNLFNQSVTELQVLTSLDNVQQTADINTVTVINNNTVNVNVAIDQTKAPNNYQMNSVGLFAVDGDGKEVLYSVTVLKDPVYIHQDAMGSALGIDLETVVGQASNVEISVNPAGAVTNEILKVALADYVKTDDVDKKLQNKQDKLGFTPADDSKVVHDNGNGTIEVNGNSILPSNDSILRRIDGLYTDMNNVPIGWWYLNGWSTPSTSISNWGLPKAFYYVHCFTTSYGLPTAIQAAYDVASNNVYVRTMSNFKWNSWKLTADDSKVVHTADMRKPASDVAGIEEVNAKQDKLTITPADDSKVVHTSDTSNWQKQKMFNPGSYMVASTRGAKLDFYDLLTQKYTTAGVYYIRDDDAVIDSVVISEGNGWWYAYGVNYAGNFYHRKIATTTNPVTDTGWVLNADDSKVVHLSGANNFDTTPTVNNNPLLLASSLPSDLARTGQDANFTGKLQQNGQDVALANNTIARNPNTGVVSEPVDFTKLTVNGGKSVATSDDLKSVEDASWHTMTGKSDSLSAYTCMYRKNNEQKYVDLVLYGTMGITMGTSDPSKELLDLSEIISSPKNVEGNIAHPAHAANGAGVAGDVSVSGTKILFSWKSNNSALYAGSPIVSTGTSLNSPFLRVTFD